MISDIVMLALEIIGTISFAVSGAVVAIRAKLDIFGVSFIGSVTAVGGGIVRDLLLGKNPPSIFLNFYIFIISVTTSIIVFIVTYIYRRRFSELSEKIEYINNFYDAVGLAAFSVMGTEVAFVNGVGNNMFFAVTLGTLTGIGGGIFRDIMTDTTPFVFKKHIYALASIAGSCMYYILRVNFDNILVTSFVSMLFVFTIRMLATKYCWSLPKVQIDK